MPREPTSSIQVAFMHRIGTADNLTGRDRGILPVGSTGEVDLG